MQVKARSGPILAILAAILFGVSPALCKTIVATISPLALAGILYLGSGLGLMGWQVLNGRSPIQGLSRLDTRTRWKLAGAVLFGGVLAPIFLIYGVSGTSAFEVSLLLNLEAVATTFLAWLVFKEHVSARVWAGKILIIGGCALTVMSTETSVGFSLAGLWVILACVFWGIDNNLTRDVDDLPPVVLASVKGLMAGTTNLTLAFVLKENFGSTSVQLTGHLIGAFSYGLSLVLFIRALRALGSSRTSSYFATGPFWGMVFALAFLGDSPSTLNWVAAGCMALGALVLYKEVHQHEHTHEPLSHTHKHSHDEHHQHEHDGTEGPEPHAHPHQHKPLTHTHAHWPDIHHRHSH